MTTLERTLVLIKPDAIKRGIMGRVLNRFEEAGLKIVAGRFTRMDDELMRAHYFDLEERWNRSVYELTAQFMQSGPILALVLEGVDSVKNTRKLVGTTFPNESPAGTIRGDFAHVSKAHTDDIHKSIFNLVHASGSPEEAQREIEVWFDEAQIFAYDIAAEQLVY